jgi:hypothetical protein
VPTTGTVQERTGGAVTHSRRTNPVRQSRAFEWLMDRQSLLKSLDAEIVDATAYSLASPSAALVNGGVGSVVR